MEPNENKKIPKLILSLVNFWPAALVVVLLMAALPSTIPVLKQIPELLVLEETEAAEPKPALPDLIKGEEEEALADSGHTYTDGVYTGSSRGYGGDIKVKVTVAGGKITDIQILSASGETSEFLSQARKVIDRVLQAQTWEVDAVSGATYSSRGILGAIRNAITGEKVENALPPEKPTPKGSLKKEKFDANAVLKDGVYTGTAMGFGGNITVEVTIKGGKIAAIRVLNHSGESDSYYKKEKKKKKKKSLTRSFPRGLPMSIQSAERPIVPTGSSMQSSAPCRRPQREAVRRQLMSRGSCHSRRHLLLTTRKSRMFPTASMTEPISWMLDARTTGCSITLSVSPWPSQTGRFSPSMHSA